ncbi:MAG: hypothetical protein Q8K60_03345 [Parachlamydiaceae bacterium]|nr:hypothetical protein [Parachlamydiaceae bacterium]
MNHITTKECIYLTANIACAAVNFYQSKYLFACGIITGTFLGIGMGIKHKFNLTIIELKSKGVQTINEISKPLQNKATETINKIEWVQKFKEAAQNSSPIFYCLYKIGIFILEYNIPFFSYLTDLKDLPAQKENVLKKLNPIPGFKGTFFSLTCFGSSIGYITWPIFSKMHWMSGIVPGYSLGLYTINLIKMDYSLCDISLK